MDMNIIEFLRLLSNISLYKLHKGMTQLRPFEHNKKVIFSVVFMSGNVYKVLGKILTFLGLFF